MFLETIHSDELAHLSYLVGDGIHAAVVDPRRDVDVYFDLAARHGARIEHVFETHRHEDFVSGATELARRAGATVHNGGGAAFEHGEPAGDGDTWELGAVRIRALETPGHTDESLSFALVDTSTGESPLGVFTGDALFVGDVGRTDFHPDRSARDAATLFDSLHGTLLPLGDEVLMMPAHGAGSVCGAGMAARDFSTLGYERRHNPALQMDRDAFVAHKLAERHAHPPYFARMEAMNRDGAGPLPLLPRPEPLDVDAFAARLADGAVVIDVRSAEAIAAARVPGALGLPLGLLSTFGGWLLPYDRPIGMVADDESEIDAAVRQLVRLGHERVDFTLAGGIVAWETSGRPLGRVGTMSARELSERLDGPDRPTVLDVRSAQEFAHSHVVGAVHVPLTRLVERLDEVPRERPVVTFCGSGQRATVAATILDDAGVAPLDVCLGSMAACRAIGCPLDEGPAVSG